MSHLPLIIVAGKAGSGKDTAAEHIALNYNAGRIALADPMKRATKQLFGFTDEQLWGPSEFRNQEVRPSGLVFPESDTIKRLAAEFVDEMELRDPRVAAAKLDAWFWGLVVKAEGNKGLISARVVLQTLGTEWGRSIDKNMWVNYAIKASRTLLVGNASYTRVDGLQLGTGINYDYVVITDGRFRNEVCGVAAVNGVSFRVLRHVADTKTVGIAGHQSEKELDGVPKHFYTDTILNDFSLQHMYDQVDTNMAVHFGDDRVLRK